MKQESVFVQPVVKDEGKESVCTWSKKCVYMCSQHEEAGDGNPDL